MKLEQTIEMMNSADFKERFKAEFYQLKLRHEGLHRMLSDYKGNRLPFVPKCPIGLLEAQLDVMEQYLDILEQRAEIEGVEL